MSELLRLLRDPTAFAVPVLAAVAITARCWLFSVSLRRDRSERQDAGVSQGMDGECARSPSPASSGEDARRSVAEAIDVHLRTDPTLDRRTRALYAATLRAIAARRSDTPDEAGLGD